eukprot:gene9606-9683_t
MTIKMFGHASRKLAGKCASLAGIFGLVASSHVYAAGIGKADPGQIGFQEAVTDVARDIHSFHDYLLLPIITIICLFVLGLLIAIVVKFNEKANPVPSKTTHHTGLEVAWTIIPVMILVVIAIPSFKLLTKEIVIPKADVTLKVTGKQWYWSYEYPKDQGGFGFDSLLADQTKLKPDQPRLLTVDNEAVVPVNKVVRIQITAADVIHSFTIASFGIRMDAVPGRLNETWFKAEREGIYYGQCSKLCGKDHAFMPIAVRVVSEAKYAEWLADAKKKFAANGQVPLNFAENVALTAQISN